jgi:hypothetical protein
MTTPHDMRVFTDEGPEVLSVPDPIERSTVAEHWNDTKRGLATGDFTRLDRYEDKTVAGRRLQKNPDEIERWALQGQLDFEDIYTVWW